MSKYQLIERERKFELAGDQVNTGSLRYKHITDYYLNGTMLRLRVTRDEAGEQFKLTKKIPLPAAGESAITTIYLDKQEFELLNVFDAVTITKTRYLQPYGELVIGLDHYKSKTDKLWLAEVEFPSVAIMQSFEMPLPHMREVTGLPDFDGYALARRFRQV